MLFKASAPGSLMLLGEYAVLHGQHALVCAIDKRIYVTLTPRADQQIILDSALGHYETTVANLQSVSPFQFVLAALNAVKKSLPQGCHLTIESEFSATVGLASSAAVTAATLAVLSQWLQLSLSKAELIKLARAVICEVQGTASGADAAACVMGGIVLYRMEPFIAEKFCHLHPITVVYSGHKTPTPIAIKQVTEKFANSPAQFVNLMKAINECTLQGVAALRQPDWQKFGDVMNTQQEFMEALGVNTIIMNNIIKQLRQQPALLGAKISGSGLGDCVVALGECSLNQAMLVAPEARQIKVNMTSEGVRCEKI